jgi:cytochrome b561
MSDQANATEFERYSSPAVLLHWLVALALAGAATAGLILGDMPDAALGRQGWGTDHAQMQLLEQVHKWANYALMAVAALHVAAAQKHHFVDRDVTLRRIWFS